MDVASRLVNLAELGTNLCRSKVPDSDLRFFLFPRYELQQRNGFLKTQGPSTLNKNKDYKGNEPIASQTLGLRFPRVLLDAPSAFSNNNNHITLRKTKKKKKKKPTPGNMETEEIFAVHSMLHLIFHRNKNQHGRTRWWKWLSILKRVTWNIAESLDQKLSLSSYGGTECPAESHKQYLAVHVAPKCYL